MNEYTISTPTHDLTINKVVAETDANDDFTFNIILNASNVSDCRSVDSISITTPAGTETLADKGYTGSIGGNTYNLSYTIKKNQSIVITGIPEGTACTVTETGVANYTAACSGAVSATGTKGQSLSVNTILDSDQTLTFTNTYSEDAFSPYVLPAAGLEDMSGIIIITFALMGLCGFTFFYVNRKEED